VGVLVRAPIVTCVVVEVDLYELHGSEEKTEKMCLKQKFTGK